MKITRFAAICVFLLIACYAPSAKVSAREVDPKTIFIYTEINEQGVDTQFLPGQSNFALRYFARVRDILTTEGYKPIFIRGSSDDHYPDFFESSDAYQDLPGFWQSAFLIRVSSYGEEDWVLLTPYANHQFPGLPMGMPYLSMQARISTERSESLEEVAQLGAAVALYTNDHCDAALPRLVEATENQALMDDGIFAYGDTMFYRASCEYDQGSVQDAITSYQAVLDAPFDYTGFEPHVFSDYAAINLAWIYVQNGEQEKAKDLLDSYATTDYGTYSSREIERFLERADLYLALGANDAAIDEITRLIEIATEANKTSVTFLSDEMARLYTERGERYLRIDQPNEALADFDQAIQTDEQYPKAYYWRGMLYSQNQSSDKAKADFEQFLALAPDYYNYYEEDLTLYIEQANEYLGQPAAAPKN